MEIVLLLYIESIENASLSLSGNGPFGCIFIGAKHARPFMLHSSHASELCWRRDRYSLLILICYWVNFYCFNTTIIFQYWRLYSTLSSKSPLSEQRSLIKLTMVWPFCSHRVLRTCMVFPSQSCMYYQFLFPSNVFHVDQNELY